MEAGGAGLGASLSGALVLSTLAGVCSGLGGAVAVLCAGEGAGPERLALWQGAVGAGLLFFGGFDILPEAAAGLSAGRAAACFLGGFAGMWALGAALRRGPGGRWRGGVVQEGLQADWGCGYVTFVSLSLHNLLEGMSICLAARQGLDKGLRLAAAVGLENLPEGCAIASPVYYATKRKTVAITLALCSGLFEPVGVLFAAVFLRSSLTHVLISSMLAVVAGIMVYVSLIEMLPSALKNVGRLRLAVLYAWLGVGVLCASLFQPLLIYHGRVGAVS